MRALWVTVPGNRFIAVPLKLLAGLLGKPRQACQMERGRRGRRNIIGPWKEGLFFRIWLGVRSWIKMEKKKKSKPPTEIVLVFLMTSQTRMLKTASQEG